MKKAICLLLCVFFLVGCGSMNKKEDTPKGEIFKITSEQIETTFENSSYIIIDVREDYEYNKEHVVDAINISLNEIEKVAEKYPKSTNIIVYCQSGNRSNKAAEKLIELGFLHIYDLGGIDTITLKKVSEEV